ncbi:MAG TPA: hypothetical protein VJ302_25615 [Blastocatellia bacterium]|nr:hypothetical protein [Blastocatellia bacterium]
MNDELKKAVEKSQAALQEAFPKERASFKSLLLANPNYFGNLPESPFTPVLPISGNTFYEELGCVGYHPQQERLEGVVYLYQPSGYGTGICGPGTPEYVRFYLSFDNGATWQDQGLTSFQAHNIPEGTDGSKRLEYAVSLAVDPARKLCLFDSLIKVRAILSWNNPPPANQPNWPPIWGNVREVTIQVEPLRFIFPQQLFDLVKIKLPSELKEVIDLEALIPTQVKSLGAVELSKLYKNKGVPVHRFAFKELAAFATSQTAVSAEALKSLLPDITIDPGIGDLLFPPKDGDISFEELKCIGLDPNSPDTLVGVIQVKKSAGYSGGPCTDGSREYVTFWADFDGNGSFETCLGTASVRVYDLSNIPAGGVHYAVRLPVDLNSYRQDCAKGPRVVRIRAILSWNLPVPCSNPNQVPTWGNREETLINIAPSAQSPAGKIAILGGIPVAHINSATGLTTPTAVFATNNLAPDPFGRECPFAGRVTVQGAPLLGHTYKVEVTPVGGGASTAVVTSLVLTRLNGTTFVHTADAATGRFTYLPFTENVNSVLAQWDTTGDAAWEVKLSTFNGGGILVGTDTHLVQLDNTGPEASITITSGAGDCGKFGPNSVLSGSFVARDLYLGSFSLGVEGAVNPPGVGVPSPSSGLVNTAPAPGNGWSLDTKNMRPCGYVVRVVVRDRAIVNSQSVGHTASDSRGFCLERSGEE